MSEMVERVAEALKEAALANMIDRFSDDDAQILARSAIEVMREPTSRMIADGESAASVGIGKPYDDEALPRVWYAMIDKALS